MLKITLLAYLVGMSDAPSHEVKLVVTDLKSNNGTVMVQLMDVNKKVVKGLSVPIKNHKAEHIFQDIADGQYSIRLFHDENNNKKLDTGFMGIPKEGYGYSNNARGTFGPPAYEKTLFDCKESKTVEIKMGY